MLDSLKQSSKTLGREISRAWENLSDGWRELLSRSSDALTHYSRHKDEPAQSEKQADKQEEKDADRALATFPRWGLLAGEMEETAQDVLVRVELPGLDKEDCRISIEGNMLRLSGEKRMERETQDSTYHVMERAYGAFQRAIALPRNVDTEQAQATFKNGVLTVRLPKTVSESAKSIPVV